MFIPFLLLAATPLVAAGDATYNVNAICTCDQMMRYYETSHKGLWGGSWWQSALLMTSLADISSLDSSYNGTYFNTYSDTYENAQSDHAGFIDDYYDDEAWWAIAWFTVYDLTKNPDYLNLAISIYNDISEGPTTPCGGIWWNKIKDKRYIATIANELYIALAAGLANRVGGDQAPLYLDAAVKGWDWFVNIGVVGDDWLVVDGVNNITCQPLPGAYWSYNQGVILSAAVELYEATGDSSYLEYAGNIANATTAKNSKFTDANGVLTECRNDSCDIQSAMFKGALFRGLRQLQLAYPHDNWKEWIETNAKALWNNALNDTAGHCNTGDYFEGPVTMVNEVTQGAALDCLVAAWAVTA